MKRIRLVCEYNPFHNGHIYHLTKAREVCGDGLIIAVLSGYFSMRGDISVINKYDKVNMPTNNITVNVKQSKKDMDAFTITANKYDDLQLADVKDKNVNIMAKNMNVAVEKQAKYVENICIKTKPVDNGFDMKDDFVFDIENKNDDNIVIDTRSDFNF